MYEGEVTELTPVETENPMGGVYADTVNNLLTFSVSSALAEMNIISQ